MQNTLISDENDLIINQIIKSFSEYNLRDIKEIGRLADNEQMDFVIAEFTLCSCLIDQISGFRYNTDKVGLRYKQFVRDYLPNYDPQKLYSDIRNRLVHNYSIGEFYQIARRSDSSQPPADSRTTRIFLTNFIGDLEDALNKFIFQLKHDVGIRCNAVKWYQRYKIIGSIT